MMTTVVTVSLGFIEGFALIISPCILPILPIVLASSLSGSKKRPLGIITGFTLGFALLALLSRQLVTLTGIDLNMLRYLSYSMLLLLGVIMISEYLTPLFARLASRMIPYNMPNAAQGGFLSGIGIGTLLAVIWTPCAGPILAAVIVQIVTQQTTLVSFFILLAFALGAGLPMLIIAWYGLKIMQVFSVFKTKAILFRKMLGLVVIASVLYMIYSEGRITSTIATQSPLRTADFLEDGLWRPYPVPKIGGIQTWINSAPIQLSDLKGKVILIDFWTYSCINCIRTLPYLKDWYQKYFDKGLVIIGVHTPEFEFEKNADNVTRAVRKDALLYPIALDNNFVTWKNFKNHYWPAHYLIDKKGMVVYEHFGEGAYDTTENNIRYLLGIHEQAVSTPTQTSFSLMQTPETYLGYERADSALSPVLLHDTMQAHHVPQALPLNAWGLEGLWQVFKDHIRGAGKDASFYIHFNAKKVFLVMGSTTKKTIKVKITLNGKPLPDLSVMQHQLYEVLALPHTTDGYLQLKFSEPGIALYTVTFGE
jgi:cytochrome c biogenesis protein CcdA/thiol-disulfide isomerase/thioredoxin